MRLPDDPRKLSGYIPLTRRERVVFNCLAQHMGKPIPGDRMIAALWKTPPKSARNILRKIIHQLKVRLEPFGFVIEGHRSGYSDSFRRLLYLPALTAKEVLHQKNGKWWLEMKPRGLDGRDKAVRVG